jgi:chorismate mutase/prephenate dehydratase
MSACLALEQPMRIAYLGPEGTFTQAAAYKQFGHSVQTMPFGAIDEVFRDVEAGHCHFGVVPIENSTEGVVNHTLDMFLHSPLKICGEVELRIHHHLAGAKGQTLETVDRVYSHQQSLAQCREWLDSRLPRAARIPVASNAEAARLVAAEERTAAICGETAAQIYGLELLSANIEDEPDNTTRFLVIGPRSVAPGGNDKTSLLLSAPNRPGALYELLAPFSDNGISMTKIESRPSRRGTWEYVFFIDIQGHAREPKVAEALEAVAKRAAVLKVLGSYPKAVL